MPAEPQTGSSSRVLGELVFPEPPGLTVGLGKVVAGKGPALTSWGLNSHGIVVWAACLANT